MNLTLRSLPGWWRTRQGFLKPHAPKVLPNATGTIIQLRYPRADGMTMFSNTLEELERYLSERQGTPYNRLVIVAELPTGRTLKRLQKLCREYGAGLMEAPANQPREATQ